MKSRPGSGNIGWSANQEYIDYNSPGGFSASGTEIVADDVMAYLEGATLTLYPVKDVIETSIEVSMGSYTLEEDGSVPEDAEPEITSNLPENYLTVEYIRVINGTPVSTSPTLPTIPGVYSVKVSTTGLSASEIDEDDGSIRKRGHTAQSASADFFVYGADGVVTPNTELYYTGNPQELVSYDEDNFSGLITFSDSKDGTYTTTVPREQMPVHILFGIRLPTENR